MAGNSRRTELQVLIQAMVAIQYEIKALTVPDKRTEEAVEEARQLQVDAKTLMQSAVADANALALTGGGHFYSSEPHDGCC